MSETIIVPGMTVTPGVELVNNNLVELNATDEHSYVAKYINPKMYDSSFKDAHLLEINSVITRDPSNVGGENCKADISGKNVMFSGKIEWYEADESLGRVEGNRVGVMITPPDGIEESLLDGVKFHIAGKVYDKTAMDEHEGKKVLWYYPLVKGDEESYQVLVEWGPTDIEVFNIFISPTTELLPKA